MTELHNKIGTELKGFGGYLKCEKCGKTSEVGDIENNIRNGWKKCCGLTFDRLCLPAPNINSGE